jgi:hypothetical protein
MCTGPAPELRRETYATFGITLACCPKRPTAVATPCMQASIRRPRFAGSSARLSGNLSHDASLSPAHFAWYRHCVGCRLGGVQLTPTRSSRLGRVAPPARRVRPAAHVVLFTCGTSLFVPGALFGLPGGVLFGPVWGTLLNLTGATLGATAAFLVAGYIVADWLRGRAAGRMEWLSLAWRQRAGVSSPSRVSYR